MKVKRILVALLFACAIAAPVSARMTMLCRVMQVNMNEACAPGGSALECAYWGFRMAYEGCW